MVFGIFTLVIALGISAIAAYYSIVGLTAIFAAAVVPIIIMGAALEIGKITAAVWLKINWSRANISYKLYLVPAVTILMLLTSMGIFGFLSKAHSDQTLVSGDSAARLALYDEKIKIQRENIDTARKALAQMDAQVNERLTRGTSEQGVERAALLRRQQQQERTKLLKDVSDAQTAIQKLNEERAPVAAELRKVEAEVGPIKYIAALIYGNNTDSSLLEKAVSWVIIVIVAVFDPLALVLILAAQQSIRWHYQSKKIPDAEPLPSPNISDNLTTETLPTKEFRIEDHAYLSKPWIPVPSGDPMVASETKLPETETTIETKPLPERKKKVHTTEQKVELPVMNVEQIPSMVETEESKVKRIEGNYFEYEDKKYSKEVFMNLYPELYRKVIQQTREPQSSFGTQYPDNPVTGDLFVNVSQIPYRLYKHNGDKWIKTDKNKTDSYVYNDKYIDYIVNELQNGVLELDQLTTAEQDAVAEKLRKEQNGKS